MCVLSYMLICNLCPQMYMHVFTIAYDIMNMYILNGQLSMLQQCSSTDGYRSFTFIFSSTSVHAQLHYSLLEHVCASLHNLEKVIQHIIDTI